ncbi:MAG: potassium channel family protein [Halomonas sp.]|nr:potassium channel family protein [Halomonas sp.]
MKKFSYSPKSVGVLYLLLIPIFGFIYWLFPSFWARPLSPVESIYFSVVTITTLGYGEITPVTDPARALTALESLSGILFIGLFLNSLAHRYSEKESEAAQKREDEQWRPARLLVARHICRVHQMLFNSLRWIIKHDHHLDLTQHNFPPNFTQREADAWGKEQQTRHLDYHYEELKKMIEYNNVALDSSLHPKAVSYIVAAKDVLNTCKFVVSAYKDKDGSRWGGSFNSLGVFEMEATYKEMMELYPEVEELEKPIGPPPISADEIHELVKLSNEKCDFLDLRIIE